MMRDTRAAIATSVGWGLVLAVAGYAVMRSLQVVLRHEPDPATTPWGPHSPFFWRCLTMFYAGGMASFVTWAASKGQLPATARTLAKAVPVAALLVVLQTVFFP